MGPWPAAVAPFNSKTEEKHHLETNIGNNPALECGGRCGRISPLTVSFSRSLGNLSSIQHIPAVPAARASLSRETRAAGPALFGDLNRKPRLFLMLGFHPPPGSAEWLSSGQVCASGVGILPQAPWPAQDPAFLRMSSTSDLPSPPGPWILGYPRLGGTPRPPNTRARSHLG